MAGSFRKNDVETRRRVIIEQWMRANIETRGFERFDDLHIDRIDSVWKNPDNWVEGGIEALRLANDLKGRLQLDLSVALGCSLRAEAAVTMPIIETSAELVAQLDWSPPSLYLFSKGKEPWKAGGAGVLRRLSAEVERGLKSTLTWYYLEFTQADRRHRSVFGTF